MLAKLTIVNAKDSLFLDLEKISIYWAYFGYLDPRLPRVTFCLLAHLGGTPKLGLAPLSNPLRAGHTTIIVG